MHVLQDDRIGLMTIYLANDWEIVIRLFKNNEIEEDVATQTGAGFKS